MRTWFLRSPTVLTAAALLTLGGLLAYATHQSDIAQIHSERAIFHSNQIIADLHALDATLVEAVAANRGYLLTNDGRDLTSYNAARSENANILARLRAAFADQLGEQAAPVRLDQIEGVLTENFNVLDQMIALYRNGKRDVALTRGNATYFMIHDLRDRIGALVVTEEGRLAVRLQKLRAQQRAGFWISVAGAVFAVVLICGSFISHAFYVRAQNELERLLREQHDAAVASDQAKSRFLATASHDLRQPLHAMNLFVSALRRRVQEPQGIKLVDGMAAAVESMQMMFSSLLDVSKIHAGAITPKEENFPIETVFRRLESSFADSAAAKGLILSVESSTAVVCTDPVLLESILRNLISNAIRYTRQGKVIMRCREHGGRTLLEVKDTGPGIPEDQIEAAFEEFRRLNTPSATERGLGLGLAIVRNLTKLLDLPICVHSQVNVGSTFSVEVPRAPEMAPALATQASMTGLSFAGLHILLVDDDPLVVAAVSQELEDWGAVVSPAESAASALAAAEVTPPDLAILDRDLGAGPSGIYLLDRLRDRLGRSFPAIIVTGSTDPQTLAELHRIGTPWIIKPMDADQLRSRISEILRLARSEAIN